MKKILAAVTALTVLSFGTVFANEWVNDDSIIRTEVKYKDLDEDFWGYDAICNATRYGWFAGYADSTFMPNNAITRAEAAKAVSNLLKLRLTDTIISSYDDVDSTSWYSSSVEATKGMFYPTYGNEFRPMTSITREDALYLIVNAYGYDTLSESVDMSILDTFSDSGDINSEIKKCIAVGISYGMLAGFNDGTLQPKGFLTRAQFATILDRLYSMGPNRVPTLSILDRIEISSGDYMSIPLNNREEIRAEAVYSDGTRMDFTNNLNIYTDDSDIVQIVDNRIYGIGKGSAAIKFNNANLVGHIVTVTVN